MNRRPYPSDVSDEEWAFVAPYLSLLPQTAAQRRHEVREVFHAVRYLVRTGAPWRWLPTHFPPWEAVYQQTRRWIAAGCFEAIVHDLRLLVRAAAGRRPQPSAVMVDSRTRRSTVESGQRAGVDGHKRVRGSKVHVVVDTMGTLLALAVTPANEAERQQVGALAQRVREVVGCTLRGLFVPRWAWRSCATTWTRIPSHSRHPVHAVRRPGPALVVPIDREVPPGPREPA